MQNTSENSIIGTCANQLTTTARNAVSPVIYIDEAIINSDLVSVSFTANDEWETTELSLNRLKSFAVETGMNLYDFADNNYGVHDIDTFMSENLEAVVKSFIECYRPDKVYAAIPAKLIELSQILAA